MSKDINQSTSTTGTPISAGTRQEKRKLKFRHTASSLHDYSFKTNQPWVKCSNQGEVRFIDHGPQLRFEAIHGRASDIYTDFTPLAISDNTDEDQVSGTANLPLINSGDIGLSPEIYQSTPRNAEAGSDISVSPLNENAAAETRSNQASSSINTPQSQWGYASSPGRLLLPERDLSRLQIASQSPFQWIKAFDGRQCACLMLFFVEKLAPHGDIGNAGLDLTLVIPQRARICPPLLNAILVSSAMVLVSSAKYRSENGVCRYRNVSLPSLKHETILQLYNQCIADLIEISNDSAVAHDENLLAALVLLRYHEEMDMFYTGEDQERLLHSTRFLLNAQSEMCIEAMTHDTDHTGPGSSTTVSPEIAGAYLKSFRHNVFRVALRQELTAAYLTQRPVQYPLRLWYLLDDIEAGVDDDFIWADRHLLHCARVLDFCYRPDGADGNRDMELWHDLKSYDARWEESTPASFLPLLEEQTDGEPGQLLYRTWYLSLTHLSAVQFFELSRILIRVFDPTIPRHGIHALKSHQALSHEVRGIVLHLCSMAASYPDFTPAFVQAAMAVAICGEYFVRRDEQDTLLGFLSHIEREFGWPTSRHAARLKEVWKEHT